MTGSPPNAVVRSDRVLSSRHDFEMVRVYASLHFASMVDRHPFGYFAPLCLEDHAMDETLPEDPIPSTLPRADEDQASRIRFVNRVRSDLVDHSSPPSKGFRVGIRSKPQKFARLLNFEAQTEDVREHPA